jgi:hypothetical protein
LRRRQIGFYHIFGRGENIRQQILLQNDLLVYWTINLDFMHAEKGIPPKDDETTNEQGYDKRQLCVYFQILDEVIFHG